MVHMWDLESGTCLVRYNQYLSRFYIPNDIVTGGHTINYVEGTLNNLFFICIQYIDGYTDSGVWMPQRSLKGHKDYIHSLALRNNGQECLSASEDGSVRIWGEWLMIHTDWNTNKCTCINSIALSKYVLIVLFVFCYKLNWKKKMNIDVD